MMTALRDAAGTALPRVVAPLFDSMTWRLPAGGRGEPGRPRLALTFDDGPTGETGRLLDVLAGVDAKATFFLLGRNAEQRPDAAAAVAAAGHEIGNHSWSHPDGWRTGLPEKVRQYARADAVLAAAAGRPLRWVRPPYGKFTYPLIHWARRRGQRVAMWDTMPADYSPRATAGRVARTLARSRPGSIVCLHDNARSAAVTPGVLTRALPAMRDAGWQFVTLSEGCGDPPGGGSKPGAAE